MGFLSNNYFDLYIALVADLNTFHPKERDLANAIGYPLQVEDFYDTKSLSLYKQTGKNVACTLQKQICGVFLPFF